MPNVQIPLAGDSGEQMVACVIFCCDAKPYSFASTRDSSKSCQRMANRKHSCVVHNLREKTDSGKLTTSNRQPDKVRASPRMEINGQMRIPDCVVKNGATGKWDVVDAKFPCDGDALNKQLDPGNTGKAGGKTGVSMASLGKPGTSMMTAKEKTDYNDFEVDGQQVDKVSCMTPQDAQAKKGDCDCTNA